MTRRRFSGLLVVPLLLLAGCSRTQPTVRLNGVMLGDFGRPLTGVVATTLYRSDYGALETVVDTTDFTGRFALQLPAERPVHLTVALGHLTLTDHDVITPPSGELRITGFVRQATFYIRAADSSTAWGRAFNVLEDRTLLDSPWLIVDPDSLAYRANAANALSRLLAEWRVTHVALIRQSLAATMLIAGPSFVAAECAAVMRRELDVASHAYDQFPYAIVLERATARAVFPSLTSDELRRNPAFRTRMRAALDSAFTDRRATAAVRASANAERVRAARAS